MNLTNNNPAKLMTIKATKNKLNYEINRYLNKNKVRFGPEPEPRRFVNRFRRTPPTRIGSMPPPGAPPQNIAGAFRPLQPSPVNKQINGARVRANATTNNYQPANVFLYQGQFYSPHNGRYTEVKRNGMTGANFTKYKAGNINGRYIRQNVNGKPVFTPFTGNNPANVNTKAEFTNFITTAARVRGGNVNAQAKNYLNGRGTNYKNYESVAVNWNKVRKWDKIKNASTPNAATRAPFWAAVTAEMARRFKNLAAFKRYYATNAMRLQPSNDARAQRYLREFNAANNAGKRAMGGFITKNNNNNANRKKTGGFWNLVGDELASRPPA
jgi:hypothetical protein